MTRPQIAAAVGLAVLAAVGWRWNAGRVADAWFDGDPAVVLPLADAVAAAVRDGTDPDRFHTGSDRFDGEWALVTCQMAILGLGAVVEDHPDTALRYRPAIAGCARWLLLPRARAFGTAAWGQDGLEALEGLDGHAYLGWLGLALGAAVRAGVDDPEVRAGRDALADGLARRMEALPVHAFETYPGETYPPDLAAVAAAVGLHGGHAEVLRAWLDRYRDAAIDPGSGLLRQALDPRTGRPADLPRGSGTALAAAFLVHADADLAHDLAAAARRELTGGVLGFGGLREVRRGDPSRIDVDSGPVVLGLGVSASGFGLATARVLGDRDWHRSIYRTAHLAGAPTACGDRRWYWTGGALGNAILLAMLTTGDP